MGIDHGASFTEIPKAVVSLENKENLFSKHKRFLNADAVETRGRSLTHVWVYGCRRRFEILTLFRTKIL